MTSKRMFYALSGLSALLVMAVVGIVYYSNSLLQNSANEVVAAKLEIVKTDETERIYRNNIGTLANNADVAEKLEQIVPSSKDEIIAIELLFDSANTAGLEITSITLPGSTLDPSSAKKKKVSVSQAVPVKGMNGVYEIPIEVSMQRNPDDPQSTAKFLNLLRLIENSPRNMRVTAINYGVDTEEVSVSVSIFVKG